MKKSRSRSRSPMRTEQHHRNSDEPREASGYTHEPSKYEEEREPHKMHQPENEEVGQHIPSEPEVVTEVTLFATTSSEGGDKVAQHIEAVLVQPALEDYTATSSSVEHPSSDQGPDTVSAHVPSPPMETQGVEMKGEEAGQSGAEALQGEGSLGIRVLPGDPQTTNIHISLPTQGLQEEPQVNITQPHLQSPEEETKQTTPKSQAKRQKGRSRSPRSGTDSELAASDGSKFILTKFSKKAPESSRYKCIKCKVEIQKKSIESHASSKSHMKHS
mmetsp:Transcript_18969/g.34368  ORF Transcript_18969/g.34368 Transcript_18969/m.34368 type:complete len:273 (+) Transcript_18969:275-1093(+)